MAKSYKSIEAGMKALGQAPALGQVALSAARELATAANRADPEGNYEATPRTVIVGWKNERRAGAAVSETTPSWRGSRDRVLARIAGHMKTRGS
ncbi:hypothetical protein [Arthrobacter glacialis]|uniref:hypothetical protein n=1 Tax=Arthrobacter glacialis TaxID=1664 RepID=UPI000CD42559|nr:hypothetical protein [Arthrobacter glacialis]POH58918.1 hypothetical protein CVS28_09425 [Arthrobacter glacialis]